MFQGLALVDLANLKWGDIRDIEVIDKEKYARDSGQMTVLPFLLPFTEAIKNVPMGLIAQNMGRNPAEIETYLKDFDRDSVIDASKE